MEEIIRTKEQIKKLRDTLIKELAELPDYNIFNESNAESKKESRQFISELNDFLESGAIPTDKNSEIYYWLTNEKSTFAKDCGIED